MRNPKFKQIIPNYRKRVLEVVLREGKKLNRYNLPFAVFTGIRIGPDNRFVSITIEADLAEQGATFVLEDGTRGDFPADFVLFRPHLPMVSHQSAQTSIEDQNLRFEALISGVGRCPQYFTNPSRASPAGESGFKAVPAAFQNRSSRGI